MDVESLTKQRSFLLWSGLVLRGYYQYLEAVAGPGPAGGWRRRQRLLHRQRPQHWRQRRRRRRRPQHQLWRHLIEYWRLRLRPPPRWAADHACNELSQKWMAQIPAKRLGQRTICQWTPFPRPWCPFTSWLLQNTTKYYRLLHNSTFAIHYYIIIRNTT